MASIWRQFHKGYLNHLPLKISLEVTEKSTTTKMSFNSPRSQWVNSGGKTSSDGLMVKNTNSVIKCKWSTIM